MNTTSHMNLDRLKALIRLANNNPSEHEANSAARRVCQELAKNDFAWIRPVRTAADKINQHAKNYGAGTWADVKRSTEPEFRSKPPDQAAYTSQSYDHFADFIRNYGQRGGKSWMGFDWDKAPHVDRQNEPSWDEETKGSWAKPNPNIKYDANGKRVREHAERTCSKCGFKVDTFRTTEEPFVCNPCHWKEF